MKYVKLETSREGYSPNQCGHSMTVSELIDFLSQYDDDQEVFFSNDNGYTYGRITSEGIDEIDDGEEDE